MIFKKLFNKNAKQKERFAGILAQEEEVRKKPIPILDDTFEEESTGVLSQLKKYPFFRFAEFIKTQRTSFNKQSVFVVEILHDAVNVAVVARKGVFLDVVFLKSYSYETLKKSYEHIVPNSKNALEEIKNSTETIISIVGYDIAFTLPKMLVIIDGNHGGLSEIAIPAGRFDDKSYGEESMLRELSSETGFDKEDLTFSAIKKPFKKGDNELGFLVSWAEKEYYDSMYGHITNAGFEMKKLHSLHSSFFASFALKEYESAMRIHVQGDTAYLLKKEKQNPFEFYLFNIFEEYESIQTLSLDIEHVILSGEGSYYEMLKTSLLEEGVSVRWWNYAYDLKKSIIRLNEGVNLTNRYANIISTAYYKLFNSRFALIQLGVGGKLSFYEFTVSNLSALPIMITAVSPSGLLF